MTADQTVRLFDPRRTIIHGDGDGDGDDDYGDDNLNPGYNENDPFNSPLGDIPRPLFLILALAFIIRPKQKKKMFLDIDRLSKKCREWTEIYLTAN